MRTTALAEHAYGTQRLSPKTMLDIWQLQPGEEYNVAASGIAATPLPNLMKTGRHISESTTEDHASSSDRATTALLTIQAVMTKDHFNIDDNHPRTLEKELEGPTSS